MAAVSAYNGLPRRHTGCSPESLWRSLRPAEPRWRHRTIKATIGDRPEITDAEWLKFLDDAAIVDAQAYADATMSVQENLVGLQKLLHSQQERRAMKRRIGYSRNSKRNDVVQLLSGDRVLARSTQYVSAAGHGKFDSTSDGLKEYTVLSVSGDIALLQDESTGQQCSRHVTLLKVMPKVLQPAAVEDLPSPKTKQLIEDMPQVGPFYKVRAEADGGCLFRSMVMGQQHLGGIHACHLQDNKEAALAMRQQVVQHSKRWLQGLTAPELANTEELLKAELLDEPTWKHDAEWSWDTFHTWLEQPLTYATAYCIGLFSKLTGITVRVWQQRDEKLNMVWEEAGGGNGLLSLLRTGNHYDLLVPAQRFRARGKLAPKLCGYE